MAIGETCEHGQLKRQCGYCERDDRIRAAFGAGWTAAMLAAREKAGED